MNQNSYSVQLSQDDRRVAHIQARITLSSPFLRMSNDGAELVAEGYAEFVRGLSIEDACGNEVQVEYTGRGEWKIERSCPQPLTLRYTVVLTHDQDAQWPAGLDEAPHLTQYSIFWTGRALFIHPETLDAATVRFDIPPDWRLCVPWSVHRERMHTYAVTGKDDLIEAVVLAGTYLERRITAGDARMLLAIGPELQSSARQLHAAVRKLFTASVDLFHGSPGSKFLCAIDRHPMISRPGTMYGGAIGRCVSILLASQPTPGYSTEWVGIVGHEIFHLWNGVGIQTEDIPFNWFREGFTRYYGEIILPRRVGLISREDMLARLQDTYAHYLDEAGKSPGIALNAVDSGTLPYHAGCCIAWALDLMIRDRTCNAFTLDTVMRALYQEYITTGRECSLASIVATASRISKMDLGVFFARYVEGDDILNMDGYLSICGLEVTYEAVPDAKHVVHTLLRIRSLTVTKRLTIHRSQQAGYQDGDVLVSVGGKRTKNVADIQDACKKLNSGTVVVVRVLRNGRRVTIKYVLGGPAGDSVAPEPTMKIRVKPEISDAQRTVLAEVMGD